MINNKFNIGDIVKITNSVAFYSTYYKMANEMELDVWEENRMLPEDYETINWKVINVKKHLSSSDILYGIEDENKTCQYIIGEYGLELVEPTFPEKWMIQYNEENKELLEKWRQTVCLKHYKNSLIKDGFWLLSEHPFDESYYFGNNIDEYILYKRYKIITLDQFKKHILKNISMPTPQLDPSQKITISRELLNEYYEAATDNQRKFINDNFKINGETTIAAIIELHALACEKWKPIITKNHPDCFPEESKYFDLTKLAIQDNSVLFSNDKAKEIGFKDNNFMQILISSAPSEELRNKGFYLSRDYNWEFTKLSNGGCMLIPSRK